MNNHIWSSTDFWVCTGIALLPEFCQIQIRRQAAAGTSRLQSASPVRKFSGWKTLIAPINLTSHCLSPCQLSTRKFKNENYHHAVRYFIFWRYILMFHLYLSVLQRYPSSLVARGNSAWRSPAVSVVNVEHHDGHILVLVVELPWLVVELGLHLNNVRCRMWDSIHHPSHQKVKRSQECRVN